MNTGTMEVVGLFCWLITSLVIIGWAVSEVIKFLRRCYHEYKKNSR